MNRTTKKHVLQVKIRILRNSIKNSLHCIAEAEQTGNHKLADIIISSLKSKMQASIALKKQHVALLNCDA